MYDEEAAAAVEEAAESLGTGAGVDPLDALLNMDKRAEDVRDTFPVSLIDGTKVEWTVRALAGSEIEEMQDRCTRWVKRGRGGKVQEVDNGAFQDLLVATATVSPPLANDRVLSKYRCSRPEQVVKKVLLPGTIDGLASKILEVSGYTDDLVSVAGN